MDAMAQKPKKTKAGPWVILACLLLLVAGAPYLLGGQEEEPWSGGGDREPASPGEETLASEGPSRAPPGEEPAAVEPRGEAGKIRAESATIQGTVQLDRSLLGKVTAFTIRVVEAVNQVPGRPGKVRTFRHTWPLGPRQALATFEFHDLPFTDFGWRVSVFVPGVNGSHQIVLPRPDDAVKRVHLKLGKAGMVSIHVKDQEYRPIKDVKVLLLPKGSHLAGRPAYRGKSDLLGSILLENVLAGEYDCIVGERGNPLIPVKTVRIHQGEEHKLLTIEVKRGGTALFRVSLPGGFGAGDVLVEAVLKDSKRFRKYVGRTDKTGLVKLEHLPPGEYYVHFTKKGFNRGFAKVTVPADGKIENHVSLTFIR